jgi:hypothetical protein
MVSPGHLTRNKTLNSISTNTPQPPDVAGEFSLYNAGEYPNNEHPGVLERKQKMLSIILDQENNEPDHKETDDRGSSIGFGISIGASLGFIFGLLLFEDDFAVGIGIGVAIGLIVGAIIDSHRKN